MAWIRPIHLNRPIYLMIIHSKTNLFLQVGRVRPEDHRHLLATLFLPLNHLYDEVELSPLPAHSGLRLQQTGRVIPDTPPEKNLAVRAASLFCNHFGLSSDWLISLRKNIPIAAGLGGGSADAAAVLRLLSEQVHPCSVEELRSLALSLGADVPFFLQDSPAFATGVGELLTPISISAAFEVVVVFPGFPSTVQWAFQHCPERAVLPSLPPHVSSLDSVEKIAALVQNDLAIPLKRKFPFLQTILAAMRSAGCLAAEISGSGSSCFGICAPRSAPAILEHLAISLKAFPRCECIHAATYSRSEGLE